jgi:hypothetical protein
VVCSVEVIAIGGSYMLLHEITCFHFIRGEVFSHNTVFFFLCVV